MKKTFLFFTIFCISIVSFAQSNPDGAWISKGGEHQTVLLLKDGYFTSTEYSKNTFINSWGGPFIIIGDKINIKKEFDAQNNDETGTANKFPFQ